MRLFVALEIPENLKGKIMHVQSKLKDFDIKLVEPENLHITLKFLGEVEEKRLSTVKDAISRSLEGAGAFEFTLGGVGFFGSTSYVRTVWIGLSKGSDEILGTMKSLERELKQIRPDNRFEAHLTIGRVKSGRGREDMLKVLNSLQEAEIGSATAKEIKLKSSVITSRGPVYTDIETWSLE